MLDHRPAAVVERNADRNSTSAAWGPSLPTADGPSTEGSLRTLAIRFLREDKGLELLEWAILAVIFVGLIGAYISLREAVMGLVSDTTTGVDTIP